MKNNQKQIDHLKRCQRGISVRKIKKSNLKVHLEEKIAKLQLELVNLEALIEKDQQSMNELNEQILQLQELDAESSPTDAPDNQHKEDSQSSDGYPLSKKFS